jgi:hypothetical protein
MIYAQLDKKIRRALSPPSVQIIISSLHSDCLTKWGRQFRLGIAINRLFESSVFSVQSSGVSETIKRGGFPEH